MKTLQLEKSEAVKLFPEVPEWFKKTLISSFGPECFSTDIMDRIKTVEDALSEAPEALRKECEIFPTDTEDVKNYKLLKLVIAVVNEGWVPDWSNTNQRKWWPYFEVSSGFGFSDSGYDFANAGASVGSRLCFESQEKCEYVAKQFIDLYKSFLTLK